MLLECLLALLLSLIAFSLLAVLYGGRRWAAGTVALRARLEAAREPKGAPMIEAATLEGEVAWILPEGPRPHWRGRVTRLEYELVG